MTTRRGFLGGAAGAAAAMTVGVPPSAIPAPSSVAAAGAAIASKAKRPSLSLDDLPAPLRDKIANRKIAERDDVPSFDMEDARDRLAYKWGCLRSVKPSVLHLWQHKEARERARKRALQISAERALAKVLGFDPRSIYNYDIWEMFEEDNGI